MCVQKLLVSHAYKNVMMFGGCKQDFMLVVEQKVGTSNSKDRATVKHLFAMDASEVSDAARPTYSYLLDLNACCQNKVSFRNWNMNLTHLRVCLKVR